MKSRFLPGIALKARKRKERHYRLIYTVGALALCLGILLAFVLLDADAFASSRNRSGGNHEMRPKRVDRTKLSASLKRLPLAFVLLALAVIATACAWRGEASMNRPTESQPAMSIEVPSPGQVQLPFLIAGWAVDLGALKGTGIDRVEILEGGCEGTVIGIATNGIERSDVAETYGSQFAHSGWQFEVKLLRSGDYTLAVRTKSSGVDEYSQCQAIQVTVR
jgi:hypothetical protein